MRGDMAGWGPDSQWTMGAKRSSVLLPWSRAMAVRMPRGEAVPGLGQASFRATGHSVHGLLCHL